jgi:hypothetical protein
MTISDLPVKNGGFNVRGRSADYSMLLEMKRRHLTVQAKTAMPNNTKKPITLGGAMSKGYENGVVDLYFTRGLVKNYRKF